MKQFIVFVWLNYDHAAGWGHAVHNEFGKVRSFETAAEAEVVALEEAAKIPFPCWQIVDLQSGEVVKEFEEEVEPPEA